MMTKLDRELEQLETMSRDEPVGARRDLLVYAAGWHIQTKRLGGFPGEVKRMLRREVERIRKECRVGGDVSTGNEPNRCWEAITLVEGSNIPEDKSIQRKVSRPPERRKLSPGGRLLRDWNGRTHVVDVIDSGYLYDGIMYRSLSAIARRITGAHWSGPRFFGL